MHRPQTDLIYSMEQPRGTPRGPTSTLLLYPSSSFHTSSASSLWMALGGGGRRDVLWAPTRGSHAGKILFTAVSFAPVEIWTARWTLQDVKLWDMPDCYHCQIQFPPTAAAPVPGRGVHLFMETARSWPGIFRQSLCCAESTSHQNCQHRPASPLHLFVVNSLIIYKTTKQGPKFPWNVVGAVLPPRLIPQGWTFLF